VRIHLQLIHEAVVGDDIRQCWVGASRYSAVVAERLRQMFLEQVLARKRLYWNVKADTS
jgi:hypothetical protein